MSDWSSKSMGKALWSDYLLAILSGICFGCETFMYFYALTWADASKTVGIESTYPVFVIIWSYFILNERINPVAYIGIVLALIGSLSLSFDVLKSLYAYVTAKYARFKKHHEHFVLVEKEKHELIAEDLVKKSKNKDYGRFWYPFIKQVDECRMKNYKGDLNELIDRGLDKERYYDAESEDELNSGEDKLKYFDPYTAPDLVYMENESDSDDEDDYYDGGNGDESDAGGEAEEMVGIVGSVDSTSDPFDLESSNSEQETQKGKKTSKVKTRLIESDKKKNKSKGKKNWKSWFVDLFARNKRVITGLLPIPVILSGNDFLAKIVVDRMPSNNVSALNTVGFGTVLICILLTREGREGFIPELKYNLFFGIMAEVLSVTTNYLVFTALEYHSASLVSSLSSTRPFFILIFEKIFGLSKDSVGHIVGFKLVPTLFVIAGAIIMTVFA